MVCNFSAISFCLSSPHDSAHESCVFNANSVESFHWCESVAQRFFVLGSCRFSCCLCTAWHAARSLSLGANLDIKQKLKDVRRRTAQKVCRNTRVRRARAHRWQIVARQQRRAAGRRNVWRRRSRQGRRRNCERLPSLSVARQLSGQVQVRARLQARAGEQAVFAHERPTDHACVSRRTNVLAANTNMHRMVQSTFTMATQLHAEMTPDHDEEQLPPQLKRFYANDASSPAINRQEVLVKCVEEVWCCWCCCCCFRMCHGIAVLTATEICVSTAVCDGDGAQRRLASILLWSMEK